MKLSSILSLSACVVLLSACESPARDRDGSPAANEAPQTGAISEEEFKALHELKQGGVPKLTGTMIDLGPDRAYLSLPAGARAPLPGIVVVHEWWGLNDHVKHWTDRLAAEGYAALAVDLYGGTIATTAEDALRAMKSVDKAKATATLLAAHRFLAEDARVKAPRRGSIGWCFGGGMSLALALAAPDLDAAVMYYGHPVTDPEALKPMRAPLLGIFGTRDASIPPATVAEFEAALSKAGKQHTLHSFDAEHAFANPSNPRYDERSADAAWKLVRAFFAQRLQGAN